MNNSKNPQENYQNLQIKKIIRRILLQKESKPIVDTKDRTFGNHYSDKSLT